MPHPLRSVVSSAERIRPRAHEVPDQETIYPSYHGFEPYSYIAMLMGLGGVPLRLRSSPELARA